MQKFTDAHNDMLGKLQSAQTGGTAWAIEAITNTGFIVGALRNNSTDMVQVTIQVPHGRKLGSVLDTIHIHYVLQAASTAGETIVFTGRYVWLQVGDAVPVTNSWTAMTGADLTLTLGTHPIRYYGLHDIQHNIACPVGLAEGYGGMLLIEISRGNGTHTTNLGILDIDAHSIYNKLGSTNETSD